MFSVIFEVQPKPERFDDYLGLAGILKPEIEEIDGFIDNERFESQRSKGRILSLSTWRDEKAVIRWRTLAIHHQAQERGRFEIFTDYHLRVGEITADTHVPPHQVLRDQRLDETEIGEAKAVTVSELTPPAGTDVEVALAAPATGSNGVVAREVYESIYNPGKLVLLMSWSSQSGAAGWRPRTTGIGEVRHRVVRVIRSYGMTDRREATQYYPPVQRT